MEKPRTMSAPEMGATQHDVADQNCASPSLQSSFPFTVVNPFALGDSAASSNMLDTPVKAMTRPPSRASSGIGSTNSKSLFLSSSPLSSHAEEMNKRQKQRLRANSPVITSASTTVSSPPIDGAMRRRAADRMRALPRAVSSDSLFRDFVTESSDTATDGAPSIRPLGSAPHHNAARRSPLLDQNSHCASPLPTVRRVQRPALDLTDDERLFGDGPNEGGGCHVLNAPRRTIAFAKRRSRGAPLVVLNLDMPMRRDLHPCLHETFTDGSPSSASSGA